MSNPIDSSSDEVVMWRKRIPLDPITLKQLEEEARSTKRTPELMVAYIVEEYFKRGNKDDQTHG